MTSNILMSACLVFFALAFLAWRRYLWVAKKSSHQQKDTCPYSLTDEFGDGHLLNVPHQKGIKWLTDVFSRSVERYPNHTALQIPHTGASLTFAELDTRAENIAAALAPFLTGPDQVVAVAMSQDNWQIVASHLGILKAGGTMMFIDTALPDALITHMLEDAKPVVVLTRGKDKFRDLPTLDTLAFSDRLSKNDPPPWLDDPAERLATIFYTSGTTGMPKGVECTHAGYVNLALSYADDFDLVPGMDATSLISSLGYDGSISEMYSAWVSGCAVVLLTGEQVRSGPDLLPLLREAEVTVLFCPPVLLTTLTSEPETDLPYPICRYIVPAGEAFPSTLVEPWTRGRRQIINTYGPTEASTDTSRQSLRPGETVTIGSPFANVTYVILDVGRLRPLPHGEVGELCIGGIHVARGYRNLPKETARKFITHPRFGRLFRTGDRCKIDARTQRVHFLGRIDAQLKVRGHRVEIQPVEDILQNRITEIESAVLDYQNQELVAFVMAPSILRDHSSEVAPAPAEWANRVLATLKRQLPEPSVPSRIFLVEEFVMKPLSGKIDRRCLPDLSQLPMQAEPETASTFGRRQSRDQKERAEPSGMPDHDPGVPPGSQEVLLISRDVFETKLGWDDAFVDHGGHSIVIARLAQRLHAAGWTVPVRALLSDCNTPRKVANRPQRPANALKIPSANAKSCPAGVIGDEKAAEVLSVKHFTTLQMLLVALFYAPFLIGFLCVVAFGEIGAFFITAHLWELIGVGFLMYLLALAFPFVGLVWVLLIKRLMGGDSFKRFVEPGVYPKWSRMHLRIWFVDRLQASVLRPLNMMFRSAPLMAWVLRRLGATVGNNLQCGHGVAFTGPLDLFSAKNDVAIQTGAYIQMSRWAGQELHLGPIQLESDVKISMRAAIAENVTVGRGAWITPFTPIFSNVVEGEMWEGAPARLTGRCTGLRRTAKCRPYTHSFRRLETMNILMQIFLDFWLIVVPTALVAWFAATFIPAGEQQMAGAYFSLTPLCTILWHMSLYAFTTTWGTIVLISLLGALFLRITPFSPGLYPSRGMKSALLLYRMKKMNQIQRLWTWTIFGQYLRALAGVGFLRTGGSECDLMINLVPEVAGADSQVFWAHGCLTNMLDQDAKHLNLRQLHMPANFFASNNSVSESGHFPTSFLLGVSTPASDIRFRGQMKTRLGEPITVAGNPPVRFASTAHDQENKAHGPPGFFLFLGRVFLNDIFSIGFLPIAELLVYGLLYTVLLHLGGNAVLSAFMALIFTEVALVLSCAGIKKALVGSDWGSDHEAPFWSWRHFVYFFTQDCFFAWCGTTLRISAGTVLPNIVLRWMGCRIGKRTIIASPMQAFDWNAVDFGADCFVSGLLQFHTLENMKLKVKRTEIRDGGTINSGAMVMGGAIMAPSTTLLPLSLVLKEMHLPTGIYWGSPAEPLNTMDNCPWEATASATNHR